MNKLKLTAYSSFILIAFLTILSSCHRNKTTLDHDLFHRNHGIPMNGSQNVPPNSSAATGTLDVEYRKDTKTLNYTITWTGLSGPPAGGASATLPGVTYPAIGLYGLADPGYRAFPYATLANFPNGVAQSITSGFAAATSGSYSGSVLVDGVVIKESDVLNGKFYIAIRTAAFPDGQIRGQVYFTY
jgi:hypothetical protein